MKMIFGLKLNLKTSDGEFSEEARFCVLELTGLEVGTGNIGKVMETVGDMCGLKFQSAQHAKILLMRGKS